MLMFKRFTGPCRAAMCLVGLLVLGMVGCTTQEPPKATVRYPTRPAKKVPDFMKGTIYEFTDLESSQPFPVSGWGLVVNLRGTGDSRAPSYVRDFIIRDLTKHGYGMRSQGLEDLSPTAMLADPRVAIVKVEGFIPPGARQDDHFDAYVSALQGNQTTNLAHGQLYEMELRLNGTDTDNPEGSVNVMGKARGDVMINPAYALNRTPPTPAARATMRTGIIPDGAMTKQDWPLMLRLRQADFRLSRAIEQRIDSRFQGIADMPKVRGGMGSAFAEDEGIVRVYVPRKFRGGWEHYIGVVMHLYLNSDPEFAAKRAQELAAEAVKPNAPLEDISYCWEGIGPVALSFIQPLMTDPRPEIAFAATRAAAFIGDPAALANLLAMARDANNPFRLNAVRIMGTMRDSQAVRASLRQLLHVEQSLVRIEAYRALADLRDPSIYSKVINEKFVVDLVPGKGPPLIYAARQGVPRIAIFGDKLTVRCPVMLTAFDQTLSISAVKDSQTLTIFYRGSDVREPVKMLSRPDLVELVARLGGESAPGEPKLRFSYGDIVGILQSLSRSDSLVTVPSTDKPEQVAMFTMQQAPAVEQAIGEAPTVAVQTDAQGIPDFNPNLQSKDDQDGSTARPQ